MEQRNRIWTGFLYAIGFWLVTIAGCDTMPAPGESLDCPPCDDTAALPEPIDCSYTDSWEMVYSGTQPDGSGSVDLYYVTDRIPALDPAPVLIDAWITQGEGCTIGEWVEIGEDGIEFVLTLYCEDASTDVLWQVTLWTCRDYYEGIRPGYMGYGG